VDGDDRELDVQMSYRTAAPWDIGANGAASTLVTKPRLKSSNPGSFKFVALPFR
jgi:hypothetical protein